MELRSHAAGASGELYTNAHTSIEEALHVTSVTCGMIEPLELSVVLKTAVENELVLVHNGDISSTDSMSINLCLSTEFRVGLSIVRAVLQLDDCIEKMEALQHSTGDNNARTCHVRLPFLVFFIINAILCVDRQNANSRSLGAS
jgi:hypothetical protein